MLNARTPSSETPSWPCNYTAPEQADDDEDPENRKLDFTGLGCTFGWHELYMGARYDESLKPQSVASPRHTSPWRGSALIGPAWSPEAQKPFLKFSTLQSLKMLTKMGAALDIRSCTPKQVKHYCKSPEAVTMQGTHQRVGCVNILFWNNSDEKILSCNFLHQP